ncbi:unnamed protein product, partial [marine sediment metagenome]
PANVIYVPGTMGDPPYTLNQSGKTYLLTQDITAPNSVFSIPASNVTLDLGAHTIIYNNVYDASDTNDPNWGYPDSDMGVKCFWNQINVIVLNGTIIQGAGANTGYMSGAGYSPVYIAGSGSNEVAGIMAQWNGSQVKGMRMGPGAEVHHNVLLDRGYGITSRHQGTDAIYSGDRIHHNLVLRARHNCIRGCANVYNNELYGDTFATNAFGVNATSNSVVHDNRIFGGGYMMIAIAACGGAYSGGSSDPNGFRRNVEVRDNFVHLQAIEPYT